MKVDPFASQLLRDYVEFTTRNGPFPFGEYMAHWHMVQALIRSRALGVLWDPSSSFVINF